MSPPLFWIATGSIALLLGNAAFGDGGLVDLFALQSERLALGDQVFDLLRSNDELRREIRRLHDSPRSVERLARSELGLVRPGEIVYRFASGAAATSTEEPAPPVGRDPRPR